MTDAILQYRERGLLTLQLNRPDKMLFVPC